MSTSHGGPALTIALMVAFCVTASPAWAYTANRVYWGDRGDNAISFTTLDAYQGGDLNTGGAAVSDPSGLAIDGPAGRIYWANKAASTISFANLDGSGGGALNTGGATVDQPDGLALDPGTGRIYWANYAANRISFAKLDGTGGGDLDTSGATVSNPEGVAIDPAAERIYWASYTGNRISYTNLNGAGGGSDLSTGGATMSNPSGVAIEFVAGRIFWANHTGNRISYANLNGSGGADVPTAGATVDAPTGVAVDFSSGALFWANRHANKISFANLNGGGAYDRAIAGTSPNDPSFPVLLFYPTSNGMPTIAGTGLVGSPLSCSQGAWDKDDLGGFTYRSPHSFAYTWRLNGGNIAGATGSTFTPEEPGTYTCLVTSSNQAGSSDNVASAPFEVRAPQGPAPAAPSLVGVFQSARRWTEGNALPRIARKRKLPVGTTFGFTLNEAARVRFAFTRTRPSRRAGTLRFSGHAGANRVRFKGRLSRTRKLKPGRYKLTITATNGAGQRSAPRSLTFRIVKK